MYIAGSRIDSEPHRTQGTREEKHSLFQWFDQRDSMDALRRMAQQVGPYLLIEAVMPGGTLLALALYLYRRKSA
jgi:hypothetical protein